jgi:hypothetical protein
MTHKFRIGQHVYYKGAPSGVYVVSRYFRSVMTASSNIESDIRASLTNETPRKAK